MQQSEIIEILRRELPVAFARSEVPKLIPGISKGALANADSEGNGPKRKFKVGRRVYYLRDEFLAWLDSRGQRPE